MEPKKRAGILNWQKPTRTKHEKYQISIWAWSFKIRSFLVQTLQLYVGVVYRWYLNNALCRVPFKRHRIPNTRYITLIPWLIMIIKCRAPKPFTSGFHPRTHEQRPGKPLGCTALDRLHFTLVTFRGKNITKKQYLFLGVDYYSHFDRRPKTINKSGALEKSLWFVKISM